MAFNTRTYGITGNFINVFPQPIVSTRAPTTSDKGYEIGQVWVRTDTDQAYTLTSVASGSANWALSSPGSSDVDTLTGDSGGAISPSAGDIVLAGGTNITTAGTGSQIAFNLDAAISLATSVTAPLFTASAADVAISAPASQDVVVKLGDAGGTNKFSVIDSGDVEVASIDSDGAFTTTGLTFTGLFTADASATIETAGTALTLAADNSADAVILGGGTSARAITIGQDAAAHTVAIGQAAAGAITVDTAAGVSIGAATASDFTLSGAGADLSLVSGAGRVIVNGEEAAANAITLLSAAGGLDADVALQMNLDSSQAASDAIVISASDAGGGIDIDCGTGGLAMDSTGAFSIQGAAASDVSVSGAGIDVSVVSAAGRVVLNGEEAADDALRLVSAAGGLDCDVALQLSLVSSEAAADAIVVDASDAGGGIDMSAGTGGIDIDASGAVSINSSGAAINVGNDAVAQAVNVGTGAAARTVTVGSTTTSSALVLQSGSGDITFTGTVKEIDAEFLYSSGTDLTVSQSPLLQTNGSSGAAPTGSNGDLNLMYMQDGCLMEQFIIGAQTIIAPRMTANGLDIALDNTSSEGAEYNFGARSNAKHVYTIGTDAAFFAEATFYVEDISGCLPLVIGFRKVEANNATIASYTDYAAIGLYDTTSSTNVVMLTELNSGGQTATDSTDAWGGDTSAQSVGIYVSAAGVVTFTVGGSAASTAPSFTFDSGDEVMFFCHFLNGGDVAGEVALSSLKIGYQA